MLLHASLFSQPIRLSSDRIQDEESASFFHGDTPDAPCDVKNEDSFKFKIRFQNPGTSLQISDASGNTLPTATNVSFTFPIPTVGEGLIKETGSTLTSDSYYLLYRMAPQGTDSKISIKLNPARDFDAYDIELETVQVNPSLGPNSAAPTLSSSNIRLSTTDQLWLSDLNYLTTGDNISNGIQFRFNIIKTDKANFDSLYGLLKGNVPSPDVGDVEFTISD